MTIARGGALGLDKDEFYVVATIEYAPDGQHEGLVWKLADGDPDNPPLPIKTLSYTAGVATPGPDYGKPMGIVEFEPLENSLLVLEPYIEQSDDSVHVTLYSIAVLSLCALLVGVIAAAATHVAMKQKSVQMLERSKAPWQSYGSRDEEGAPLIAKRPSLSFSV